MIVFRSHLEPLWPPDLDFITFVSTGGQTAARHEVARFTEAKAKLRSVHFSGAKLGDTQRSSPSMSTNVTEADLSRSTGIGCEGVVPVETMCHHLREERYYR
ncbi:hypothetical protein CHARACLAT_008204 [Characodon lateralis]|uniref:Uncharacterized protein n=1 Tax=Characodon lateralis TaxID=208331 RepID=A0ABU7DZN5_9TELE|nr:hypothetical protein [Characodon lateralis]